MLPQITPKLVRWIAVLAGAAIAIVVALLTTDLGAGILARVRCAGVWITSDRSEEHTSELQSHLNLVCRLLLEKKKRRQPRHLPESDTPRPRVGPDRVLAGGLGGRPAAPRTYLSIIGGRPAAYHSVKHVYELR